LNKIDFRFLQSRRYCAARNQTVTGVQDGLANGFLNKSTLTTTTGIRFKF